VISKLARAALTTGATPTTGPGPVALYGFRPFPHRGGIVTNELIDRLREEDGD
jgi:hypothetical protein